MEKRIFLLLLIASLLASASGCISLTPQLDLNMAAINNDVSSTNRLLGQGAYVNAREESGWTALHFAASKGSTAAAGVLISRGADIDARTNDGITPLLFAVLMGHKETASFLIAKGADVNARNNYGQTPLALAKQKGFKDLEELLMAKGAREGTSVSAGTTMTPEVRTPPPAARKEPEVISSDPEEEARFGKSARQYRGAKIKPELPEQARRFKVQAESAAREKSFTEAADLYGKALEVAPWWPEGHFNRAVIFGEIGRPLNAIREMKRYLTLVPNATNARTAQDKIYEWERKAGK